MMGLPVCWIWTEHGEALPLENQFGADYIGSSSIGAHIGNEDSGNIILKDNLFRYQGMIFDAANHEFGMYSDPSEEIPNSDDVRFYNLLEAVNKPL